ncbi:MAG: XdhC family protein [Pyrinomonadaceae bacterium]
MKELREILRKIESLNNKQIAVLATVVDVKGSSYRLPGARMLICEDGSTYGTVSGGCLEADVLEHANSVLKTGEPQVFVYDTSKQPDSVFSLNMGCRGIIKVLLEPLANDEFFHYLAHPIKNNKAVSIATLIESDGKLPVGAHAIFDETGCIFTDFEPEIRNSVYNLARRNYLDKFDEVIVTDDGLVFVEYIKPPLQLYIFGAGADAVPVAEIASSQGWRVTVVDHREAFATAERFNVSVEILVMHPEEFMPQTEVNTDIAYVLMTHNFQHDKIFLRAVLGTRTRYIGCLGPKRRFENIIEEFAEAGFKFSQEDLNSVYSPIGLDIGADSPEAIALAIVAEINAVFSNRSGGFLRGRNGSIYNRNRILSL